MAMKPKAKAKANVSKDYMKPVGGTKQEGYVKPGGNLFDVKADRKYVTSKTGLVTQQTRKKREELSISACRSIRKEFVPIKITF
jgi:hypothetical protein